MPSSALAAVAGEAAPTHLANLFRELNDLKRIRSAGRAGSIAARLFRAAWLALAQGEPPDAVMRRTTAATLVAARLADLDRAALAALGLAPPAVDEVLLAGFDSVAGDVAQPLRSRLRDSVGHTLSTGGEPPGFVLLLEEQPRAGVTCPGQPRIVLEPPENHAEHCLMVAVYGVLLSPAYGADAATVFLAGLAHHLHNALMPDAGFTGEVLLGPHLDGAIAHATQGALDQLPPGLRTEVVAARRILPDAATPEGRAFHAADVIDRVLQTAQHLRAASLTKGRVLDEMHLVHDGPVKPFHDRVLREMSLP
jgi:5'-deoxynucleotidase YfbR-like HD superfamily hydrolase